MSAGEFRTEVRIEALPRDVFAFLTDPALIIQWMGDWADLDPVVDGRFAVDINGVPIRGHYLVIDPPRRLVFSWGTAGNERVPPGSTVVEVMLREIEGATVLELVHRHLPAEELPQHRAGWAHFLARLVIAGSGADPGPDPWALAP